MALSTKSLLNTPQANSDSYTYSEDYFNTQSVLTLDVLANDAGGNARQLWSIDDGDGTLRDLIASNTTTGWETTADGNQIRINAGKVEFKLADSVDINALAEGETYTDTFVYAIRLANGTLSTATVTVNIEGKNDAASISGTNTGAVTEDDDAQDASGTLTVSDRDHGEATFQAVDAEDLEGTYGSFTFDEKTGAWSYTVDDSKLDNLDEGESVVETLTVKSADGTAEETISVTVNGANEANQEVVFGGYAFKIPNVYDKIAIPTDDDVKDNPILQQFVDLDADGDGLLSVVFAEVTGFLTPGEISSKDLNALFLSGDLAVSAVVDGVTYDALGLPSFGLAVLADDDVFGGTLNVVNDDTEDADYVLVTLGDTTYRYDMLDASTLFGA